VDRSVKDRPLLPRRLNADVAAGGVTLLLGALLTIAALQIPPSTFANSVVQPRHLPIVIGAGLVLCGLALTVQALLVGRLRGEQEVPESLIDDLPDEIEELPEPPESPRHLVVLSALFIGYLMTFIPLGFAVSTFLFLFVGATALEPRRIRRNLIYALLFSGVVYFVFDRLLEVALPAGILSGLL
jgi:putative tricarboxylic transport membrane protein